MEAGSRFIAGDYGASCLTMEIHSRRRSGLFFPPTELRSRETAENPRRRFYLTPNCILRLGVPGVAALRSF
jgi:hypothetical protein